MRCAYSANLLLTLFLCLAYKVNDTIEDPYCFQCEAKTFKMVGNFFNILYVKK